MTKISPSQFVKEAGSFFFATVASCGPSQLFGCIKLIVDAVLLQVNKSRKSTITSNIHNIQNDWSAFKTSATVSLIAKKLGIETDNLTQEMAENYFNAKNRKVEAKIDQLYRSLRADAYALIPLVGAHISWRVATGYEGKSFTPIFSKAVEQLLEHSKTAASRPLFFGRKPKATNAVGAVAGEYIDVSTSTKNRKIQIFYDFATGNYSAKQKQRPTVVLFHPNMGHAERLAESAEFYREKGYNTLAVTLGGYKNSPGVTTSEKSMYQDIEAVKSYLASMGVTEVAYHGFSLGTGAAMQAATGESLVKSLKTLFVVLDQPYTSAEAVGDNVAGFLGKGVLSAGCPVGLDVELPGGLWTKTDGLNSLRKVDKLKEENIPLICFEAKKDALMGRKEENGNYTENFAQDLLTARYGNTPDRAKNLVSLSGEHGLDSLQFTRLWDNNLIPSTERSLI
jgi:hypothetical protein